MKFIIYILFFTIIIFNITTTVNTNLQNNLQNYLNKNFKENDLPKKEINLKLQTEENINKLLLQKTLQKTSTSILEKNPFDDIPIIQFKNKYFRKCQRLQNFTINKFYNLTENIYFYNQSQNYQHFNTLQKNNLNFCDLPYMSHYKYLPMLDKKEDIYYFMGNYYNYCNYSNYFIGQNENGEINLQKMDLTLLCDPLFCLQNSIFKMLNFNSKNINETLLNFNNFHFLNLFFNFYKKSIVNNLDFNFYNFNKTFTIYLNEDYIVKIKQNNLIDVVASYLPKIFNLCNYCRDYNIYPILGKYEMCMNFDLPFKCDNGDDKVVTSDVTTIVTDTIFSHFTKSLMSQKLSQKLSQKKSVTSTIPIKSSIPLMSIVQKGNLINDETYFRSVPFCYCPNSIFVNSTTNEIYTIDYKNEITLSSTCDSTILFWYSLVESKIFNIIFLIIEIILLILIIFINLIPYLVNYFFEIYLKFKLSMKYQSIFRKEEEDLDNNYYYGNISNYGNSNYSSNSYYGNSSDSNSNFRNHLSTNLTDHMVVDNTQNSLQNNLQNNTLQNTLQKDDNTLQKNTQDILQKSELSTKNTKKIKKIKLPTIILKYFKNNLQNKSWKRILIDLRLISCIFLFLSFTFYFCSDLCNLLRVYNNLFKILSHLESVFYLSGCGCSLLGMLPILALWVDVMERTKKNTERISLKVVIPLVAFLFFGLISILIYAICDFFIEFYTTAIYMLCLVIVSFFIYFFLFLYALKIYFTLKKSTNISFFQFRFTRFLIISTIFGIFPAFYLVFSPISDIIQSQIERYPQTRFYMLFSGHFATFFISFLGFSLIYVLYPSTKMLKQTWKLLFYLIGMCCCNPFIFIFNYLFNNSKKVIYRNDNIDYNNNLNNNDKFGKKNGLVGSDIITINGKNKEEEENKEDTNKESTSLIGSLSDKIGNYFRLDNNVFIDSENAFYRNQFIINSNYGSNDINNNSGEEILEKLNRKEEINQQLNEKLL
ncbi:hypothetical protein ABK040_010752 [Willaertia magna]